MKRATIVTTMVERLDAAVALYSVTFAAPPDNGRPPFVVAYRVAPSAGPSSAGGHADPRDMGWIGLQLTAVGTTPTEAAHAADDALEALVGRTGQAWTVDLDGPGWTVLDRVVAVEGARDSEPLTATHNVMHRVDLLVAGTD